MDTGKAGRSTVMLSPAGLPQVLHCGNGMVRWTLRPFRHARFTQHHYLSVHVVRVDLPRRHSVLRPRRKFQSGESDPSGCLCLGLRRFRGRFGITPPLFDPSALGRITPVYTSFRDAGRAHHSRTTPR